MTTPMLLAAARALIAKADAERKKPMAGSWGWHIVQGVTYRTDCYKQNCGEPATCRVVYSYVTGRAGRVSTNEKSYCDKHGRETLAKHSEEAT